jgi:hypothetical protein
MVELKSSGAKDYWMIGDAVVSLTSITGAPASGGHAAQREAEFQSAEAESEGWEPNSAALRVASFVAYSSSILEPANRKNISDVIALTLVPMKAGDRAKTNQRDAERLARSYRSDDLTAVWAQTKVRSLVVSC